MARLANKFAVLDSESEADEDAEQEEAEQGEEEEEAEAAKKPEAKKEAKKAEAKKEAAKPEAKKQAAKKAPVEEDDDEEEEEEEEEGEESEEEAAPAPKSKEKAAAKTPAKAAPAEVEDDDDEDEEEEEEDGDESGSDDEGPPQKKFKGDGKSKGKGKGKDKGKGKGKGKGKTQLGGHAGGELGTLARALRQLHAAGMLDARCAAAVVANSLGDLIALAAEHPEVIDGATGAKPEVAQKVMQALLDHAACTEGLEDSAGKLQAALAGDAVPASEALLALLTALSELTFGARVSFLEALYTSQQEHIDCLLDKAQPFLAMLPPMPAEHGAHICDGCDQGPLRGPRFSCKTIGDFDLCARCFADKDSICGGRCAGHEFETIASTACGTGHGKCKGKGQHKGGHAVEASAVTSSTDCDSQVPADGDGQATADKDTGKGKDKNKREGTGVACANPGCGFQVTWHKTHCCGMCKQSDGKMHGPKCNKVPAPDAEGAAQEPPALVAAAADATEGSSTASFDISMPVAVGDGRHANLEWNLVDDPQEVAEAFVAVHGVVPEELPTVRHFVEQLTAAAAAARPE